MVEKILTTLLFCLSLLPPAYLRYYPFRPIVQPHTKRFLICGHIYIFLLEFVVLAALFTHHYMDIVSEVYQHLYFFCYLPHLLLLIFTIRPYWFRHMFVLGLQGMYTLFVHTVTMEIYKIVWPQFWYENDMLPYFELYLVLFLAGLPLVLKVFGRMFTKELLRVRPAFWTYLGPIPLLLVYYHGNMGYFSLDPSEVVQTSIHVYTLLSRVILLLVGVCLVISVRGGIQQVDKMFQLQKRSLALKDQVRSMNEYAVSLRKEQQKMAILRHDSRHQLRLLAELVENGHFEEAEQQLEIMQKEVEKE